MKRLSVDATASSESDSVRKRLRVGSSQEHNSCDVVKAEPETSLKLSPPGESAAPLTAGDRAEDARDDGGLVTRKGGGERGGVEMGDTSLVKMIQRMIAEEVRNYLIGMRAELGPSPHNDP